MPWVCWFPFAFWSVLQQPNRFLLEGEKLDWNWRDRERQRGVISTNEKNPWALQSRTIGRPFIITTICHMLAPKQIYGSIGLRKRSKCKMPLPWELYLPSSLAGDSDASRSEVSGRTALPREAVPINHRNKNKKRWCAATPSNASGMRHTKTFVSKERGVSRFFFDFMSLKSMWCLRM